MSAGRFSWQIREGFSRTLRECSEKAPQTPGPGAEAHNRGGGCRPRVQAVVPLSGNLSCAHEGGPGEQ
eukprot:4261405-Lingulodinium_polyedra.AAC.1